MDQPPSPQRIIDQIRTARQLFAGSVMLLPMLNDPVSFDRLQANLFPHDDHNLALGRVGASTPYDFRGYGPLVAELRSNPQFNLDYPGLMLQAMVLQIGDALAKNNYFEKTPELEFYRHIRNALGHGNRFFFKGGEPKRAATFGTRTLTPDLHGQQVFFNYMAPGDILEIWDHISGYLQTKTGISPAASA
jgi:hypothetical protein